MGKKNKKSTKGDSGSNAEVETSAADVQNEVVAATETAVPDIGVTAVHHEVQSAVEETVAEVPKVEAKVEAVVENNPLTASVSVATPESTAENVVLPETKVSATEPAVEASVNPLHTVEEVVTHKEKEIVHEVKVSAADAVHAAAPAQTKTAEPEAEVAVETLSKEAKPVEDVPRDDAQHSPLHEPVAAADLREVLTTGEAATSRTPATQTDSNPFSCIKFCIF